MSYLWQGIRIEAPCDTIPIYVDLRDRTVVVSGAGDVAVAKLRLLMKTEARIEVYGADPVRAGPRPGRGRAGSCWSSGRIEPSRRRRGRAALRRERRADEDARAAAIGRAAGALVNIVDNLEDSDFITPAIVDRDPVTVAIGTEGAAPVLARKIKAEVEAMLPATLGLLDPRSGSRSGRASRRSTRRRGAAFWTRFYFERGPAGARGGRGRGA